VLRLELILMITGGFCCDIALLFYGTALKFVTELIFLITVNSLKFGKFVELTRNDPYWYVLLYILVGLTVLFLKIIFLFFLHFIDQLDSYLLQFYHFYAFNVLSYRN